MKIVKTKVKAKRKINSNRICKNKKTREIKKGGGKNYKYLNKKIINDKCI